MVVRFRNPFQPARESKAPCSQFLNLLTFGLSSKLGRLVHYTVDAVLSTSPVLSGSCHAPRPGRLERVVLTSLHSLDDTGRDAPIDRLNVSLA